LNGRWQLDLPMTEGQFPLATRQGESAGFGVVYRDKATGELKSVKVWGGFWWSEPMPEMPPVPTQLLEHGSKPQELLGVYLTEVSMTQRPHLGDPGHPDTPAGYYVVKVQFFKVTPYESPKAGVVKQTGTLELFTDDLRAYSMLAEGVNAPAGGQAPPKFDFTVSDRRIVSIHNQGTGERWPSGPQG